MVQGHFLEFNEESGIGDLLFVNMNHPSQYRFYRRRENVDECYMIEFCSNSKGYRLHWGVNGQKSGMTDATALLLPPYPEVEWKRVDLDPLLAYDLPKIIEKIERRISNYNNKLLKND